MLPLDRLTAFCANMCGSRESEKDDDPKRLRVNILQTFDVSFKILCIGGGREIYAQIKLIFAVVFWEWGFPFAKKEKQRISFQKNKEKHFQIPSTSLVLLGDTVVLGDLLVLLEIEFLDKEYNTKETSELVLLSWRHAF